jgi:hypothetical protein
MSPSSRRKGTVRTQANTKPLDQELLARAEKRQLEEASASGEPKRVRLTTAQMGLMGLRPDPRNPERALEPINSVPVNSDALTIHRSLSPTSLAIENTASTSHRPLTRQVLRGDRDMNSRARTFRAEYELHPHQSQLPISPTSVPLSSLSSLNQVSQIPVVNHNGGSISSETSVSAPTFKELKEFMTEFKRNKELQAVDDTEQIEDERMLTAYTGL